MRKLVLGAAMLLFAQFGFGQAVSDNAVIPVSVTLNSILRLTVTSGGNINFVFNTIEQYEDGLGATPSSQYQTVFNVSSSRDFDVNLLAEDATFIGFDKAGTIPLEYCAVTTTGGTGTVLGITSLNDTPGLKIVDTGLAGKSATNTYTITWEFGTADALTAGALTDNLLEQSYDADIYMTNVFLSVTPQ